MFIFLMVMLSCEGCITQADVYLTETIYTDASTVIEINNIPVILFENPPEHSINPFFIDNMLYFKLGP